MKTNETPNLSSAKERTPNTQTTNIIRKYFNRLIGGASIIGLTMAPSAILADNSQTNVAIEDLYQTLVNDFPQAELRIKDAPDISEFDICPTLAPEIKALIDAFQAGQKVVMNDQCISNLMKSRVMPKIKYLTEEGVWNDKLSSQWETIQSNLNPRDLNYFIAELDNLINDPSTINKTNNLGDDHREIQTDYSFTMG